MFMTYRFAYGHLYGKCRRKIILEYFEEDITCHSVTDGVCCDVCETEYDMKECQDEIMSIVEAVKDNPNKGEKQVS